MAAHIETEIIEAMVSRFASMTLPAGVTVAWPGQNFEPEANVPYVRVNIQRNTPINHDIGGDMEPERMGVFQATVCWPTGIGITQASDLAGQIRDRFRFATSIDTTTGHIRIVDEPSVIDGETGSAFRETHTIVPYHWYP
ncbi:phage tail terminator-like protein [Amorphus sp. MBR-141]